MLSTTKSLTPWAKEAFGFCLQRPEFMPFCPTVDRRESLRWIDERIRSAPAGRGDGIVANVVFPTGIDRGDDLGMPER